MAKNKELKFEEALEKLEVMVRKMEEGNLSLDDSLVLFEEGMELTQFCEQKLKEAQGRVETILSNKQKQDNLAWQSLI